MVRNEKIEEWSITLFLTLTLLNSYTVVERQISYFIFFFNTLVLLWCAMKRLRRWSITLFLTLTFLNSDTVMECHINYFVTILINILVLLWCAMKR